MDMVERDEKERKIYQEEEEISKDAQIIGKKSRTEVMNDILPEDQTKLTTEQKIRRELAYVTKALALDERG